MNSRKTIRYTMEDVAPAVAMLQKGGLVALPTETVYGLAVNAENSAAVWVLYEVKQREREKALSVLVTGMEMVENYCQNIPPQAYALAEHYWPGPLTMILEDKGVVSALVNDGSGTLGVRCPDHPLTQAILRQAGVALAAPSANPSDQPSPKTAQEVLDYFDGHIEGIVDGGPCAVGVESTILDLTVTPPQLLRPGGMPLEALEGVVGEIAVDHAVTGQLKPDEKPRAPGMKYRHYAPHAKVTVLTGDGAKTAAYIREKITPGAGVICFDEYAELFPDCITHCLGPEGDKAEQARRVFDALREFDHTDVTEIYAQCPDDTGLGLAIGNRLKKAAGFHLIDADRPLIVGLTGGTGAGKTSALAALVDLGGTVLDCDAVYHQMLRTDPALREAITAAFGPVFCPDGSLDRQKLGTLVFSDHAALDRLNAIVYEYLPPELMRRAAGQSLVGLDAINLVESGLDRLCACTVAVLAPAEDRVRRIMARDGISRDYARLRISAQPSDGFYREHCSHILENTCAGPAQFRDQARIFFRKMLREIEHL